MHDQPLPDEEPSPPFWQRFPHYVGYLVFWIVYSAITFWLIFAWREIAVGLSLRLNLNPWQVRAVDRFSVFVLGLVWLSGMVVAEGYFRHGAANGSLWRRLGKVFLTLLIVVGLTIGAQLILT